MYKNFLRILSLVTIILSQSANALPYDDSAGRNAPPSVRRAADALDQAMVAWRKTHRISAWLERKHGLLGDYDEEHSLPQTSCLPCFPNPPMKPFSRDTRWKYHENKKGAYHEAEAVWKAALSTLSRAVNEGVSQPVGYEGDMNLDICVLVCTDGLLRMNGTEERVVSWVSAHGGWKTGRTDVVGYVIEGGAVNPILMNR